MWHRNRVQLGLDYEDREVIIVDLGDRHAVLLRDDYKRLCQIQIGSWGIYRHRVERLWHPTVYAKDPKGKKRAVSAARLILDAGPDEQVVYLSESRFDLRPENITKEHESWAGRRRSDMRAARRAAEEEERYPLLKEVRDRRRAREAEGIQQS